jgi:hypothetical protein
LVRVVIGAQPQANHLIHHLAARRQHQDRHAAAALPHRRAYVETALPRQHQVEIQQQESQAARAAMQKMQQDEDNLQNLLQSNTGEPATLGNLLLDIRRPVALDWSADAR